MLLSTVFLLSWRYPSPLPVVLQGKPVIKFVPEEKKMKAVL